MPFSIDRFHFRSELIFENLPPEEFRLVQSLTRRVEVKKGKVLFRAGHYSKGVFILKKGKVKIYQQNKEGRETIAYIFREGEIVGYRPLLCDEPHPVSGKALEDCSINFIDKKSFLRLLDEAPSFSRKLLVNLSHEFSVLINQVTVLSQLAVRERVALTLRILHEKYRKEEKGNAAVVIDLSRSDLANYAGTSIETLVRVLRVFKNDNIIKSEGRRITVLKPKELEKIAEFYG